MQWSPSLQGTINRASHWFFKCTKHMQMCGSKTVRMGSQQTLSFPLVIRALQTWDCKSQEPGSGKSSTQYNIIAEQVKHHTAQCTQEIVEQFSSLHCIPWCSKTSLCKINKHYKYSTRSRILSKLNRPSLFPSTRSHLTKTKTTFLPQPNTYAKHHRSHEVIHWDATLPKLQDLSSSVQLLRYADLCPCDARQVYQRKVILRR